jgi:hypothetical protein
MRVTIGRRELLAALGGAAAWPLAARAQQAHGLMTSARIAFLDGGGRKKSSELILVMSPKR